MKIKSAWMRTRNKNMEIYCYSRLITDNISDTDDLQFVKFKMSLTTQI